MRADGPRAITRRNILRGAVVAGGAAIAGRRVTAQQQSAIALPSNRAVPALAAADVILFQGDSITDAGRDRKVASANSPAALGNGYAVMIAARLLGLFPQLRLQCYNRGISGNKVPDLDARWQVDALDLKPRVLSILIGVNDIWHKLGGRYDGTVTDYETGLNALIDRTRAALPDTALVICEPFILRCGAVNDAWFPEFDERRAAARRVAEDARALWVPLQAAFDSAISDDTPPQYWAGDGVHPTMAGHALMAKAWLDATGWDA